MALILTLVFAYGTAIYVFNNQYLLCAIVLTFYILIDKICAWHRRRKFLIRAVIYHHGKKIPLNALFDSGNGLIDPDSKTPITLISLPIFLDLFPEITATQIITHELDQQINGHYVNCHTVNGKGKIFVFKPDKFKVDGINVTNTLLGVSGKNLGNTQCQALLNRNLEGIV